MKLANLDDLLDLDEETVERIHLAAHVEARRQYAADELARVIAERQKRRLGAIGRGEP